MELTIVKKINATINQRIATGIIGAFAAFSTFPALAGGLDDATDAAGELKTWGYTFLGVVVFVYLIYKVVMALMEKETWGDVLGALGKVACAGGVIVAGEWAWSIFGS